MRSNNKKFIIIIFISFIMINGAMDFLHYQNYRDKVDIIAAYTASEGKSTMDISSDLLKGRNILKSYGYFGEVEDQYLKEFYGDALKTLVFFAILYGVIICVMVKKNLQYKKDRSKTLLNMERSIMEFRSGSGKLLLMDNDEDEGISRINRQLEALNDYLIYIREEALAEKNETKGLVTDISHQLKTPVAALDTCFTVLSGQDLSQEERKEFSLRCRDELDGLEELLKSLMEISKLESGMINLSLEESPVFDTLVMAVNRIYPKAMNKNIEIELEENSDLENLKVVHDNKWMGEALINILDNGIKYSPEGSTIKINMVKENFFLKITVKDQGIGVNKKDYHKIFQRFYRGTAPEIKNESGAGVGLYLVRKILTMHKGIVTVSSPKSMEQKKYPGTTFMLQIPIVEVNCNN